MSIRNFKDVLFEYPSGEFGSEKSISRFDLNYSKNLERDLMRMLVCLSVNYLQNPHTIQIVSLNYLPYGREDRVSNRLPTLKGFAHLLNMLNCHVVVFDPHNPEAVHHAFERCDITYPDYGSLMYRYNPDDTFIICPDQGALKRAERASDGVFEIVRFDKKRVSKDRIEMKALDPIPNKKTGIVIDDICDGGGTFIELARHLPETELHLVVSHGLFTKGTYDLKKYYKKIFTISNMNDQRFFSEVR